MQKCIFTSRVIPYFFAAVLFLSQASTSHAATPSGGLRFACLSMQSCRKEASGANNCSTISPHRVLLTPGTQNGFLNDPYTYITECLQVDENGDGIHESICTTGNSQLDQELFCGDDPTCKNNNLARLQHNPSIKYSLNSTAQDGIFFMINGRPVKQSTATKVSTDANGRIIPPRIEWQSSTKSRTVRRFLIWNKVPPPPAPADPTDPSPAVTGGIGGQQQGTLTFPFQNPATDAIPSSDCTGMAWDPFGRAFDTKTLEPVTDAQITLKQLNPANAQYDQEFANLNNPNITNPDITGKDGVFSFVVIDGTYILNPSHPSYTHANGDTTSLLTASPNTAKIYSDLYFSNNNNPEPIVQKGTIQHRDIPLEPSNGIGYRYPLSLLDEYEIPVEKQLNGTVTSVQYGGTVSHPFADLTVEICSILTGICRDPVAYNQAKGGPDRNGIFLITLRQTDLQSGEYYKKTFAAADLTQKSLSATESLWNNLKHALTALFSPRTVQAQDSSRSISVNSYPIATYLEGYAYDAEGRLMPNAQVMIYTKYSPRPVYRTNTTTNGYFKITSEYLPRTPYTIRYALPSRSHIETELTTSQFLQQNVDFHQIEKINPFLITNNIKDPRKDIAPAFQPASVISPLPGVQDVIQPDNNNSPKTSPTPPQQPEKNIAVQQNSSLVIIGVFLLFISLIGIIGTYMLLHKQPHH